MEYVVLSDAKSVQVPEIRNSDWVGNLSRNWVPIVRNVCVSKAEVRSGRNLKNL